MKEQNDLMPILPNDEEGDKQEEGKEEENAQKEGKGEDKEKEKEEKIRLYEKLKELENNLIQIKYNSIPEAYEDYLNNEDITKRNIKEGTNECLMVFMFYIIAPLFGIIFLIGIFQVISLKKSFAGLLKRSIKDYYKCQIKTNCNMTVVSSEPEYHFYEYFYDSSMNETIDFNLMMITAFIGELFLKSRGFRISSGILSLINIGCMFWIYNFDTEIKPDDKEYYSIIKLVSILVCYLMLLIGIGSSALLSQQILIDSHLKYKEYIIKKKRENLQKNKNITGDNKISGKELIPINEEQNELLIKNNKTKIEREKKMEKRLKNREKNKFDFFFMICLTTTIGYFGKYSINLIINYILKKKEGLEYDKKLYFECIIGLYCSSIILSISLYSIFVLIFTKNQKTKAGDNVYRICQVCGFVIYSEEITLKK